MSQTAYHIEEIDMSALTGKLAIKWSQGQAITALALLSIPSGTQLDISIGKGGPAIPLTAGISLEWSDCEEGETGGIFFQVVTAGAGLARIYIASRVTVQG